MTRDSEFTLILTLEGKHSSERHSMAIDLGTEVASIHRRTVEEMKMGAPSVLTFDAVVRILKRKEFRKKLLVAEATRLGHKLAAYMEDKEGWHGADRQEAIDRLEVRR